MLAARRRRRPDHLELLVVVTAGLAAALLVAPSRHPAVPVPAVPVVSQGASHSQVLPHPAHLSGARPVRVRTVVERSEKARPVAGAPVGR